MAGEEVSKSKVKGTLFERQVADGLRSMLGQGIDRAVLHGAFDIGDVTPFQSPNGLVVVECKNAQKYALAEWLGETEVERRNAGADIGALFVKRRGKGRFLDQIVVLTVRDFLRLGWGDVCSG